jgi:hypothetical protein
MNFSKYYMHLHIVLPYSPYLYVGTYSPRVVIFTRTPPGQGGAFDFILWERGGWLLKFNLCERRYGVFYSDGPARLAGGGTPWSLLREACGQLLEGGGYLLRRARFSCLLALHAPHGPHGRGLAPHKHKTTQPQPPTSALSVCCSKETHYRQRRCLTFKY